MSFGTVVNCIDGRVQIPVINFLLERFGVSYIDIISEIGPNRILAEQLDKGKVASILQRLNVSILKHGSRFIAVVGHYDCGGNPADRAQQVDQLKESVAFLKESYPGLEDRFWTQLIGESANQNQ